MLTAILVVLTIVVLLIASGLFCRKSDFAIAVESGYFLAMAIVMIVCQGIF